jgi:hypothetical protein
MVAPGPLVQEHAKISTDCFACHTALRGVSSQKCVTCHALKDIGLRTTEGSPVAASKVKGTFHQDLTEQNCVVCHSDHAGPRLTQKDQKPFSHGLLRLEVREQCQSCHKAPVNALHKQLVGACKQCHSQLAWKPASFDHDKFFLLDGDHLAECATCHVQNDYSKYTCYGCHEHTPSKVIAEHREEGIKDFENCVKCHRSARGEAEGESDD